MALDPSKGDSVMNLNKNALGVAVAVALLSTSAFAVSPYGNTNQKSSLLIFPLIDISRGKDTLIRITNDHGAYVAIKCYYQATDGKDITIQYRADLSFTLTNTHPAHWWASTGLSTGNAIIGAINTRQFGNMPSNLPAGPDGKVPRGDPEVGEMKCWAVNDAIDEPINFNHLIGSATVFDHDQGTAAEYNAWGFQARPINAKPGNPVGTVDDTGSVRKITMLLNGASLQYDNVPKSNLGQFTPVGPRKDKDHYSAADKGEAHDWTILYLAAGTQDFRQGAAAIITKYAFTFYNQDESRVGGDHVCAASWLEQDLAKLNGATYDLLGTDSAYYRVESYGDKAVCGSAAQVVGMVGVQVHGTFGKADRDLAIQDARPHNIFVRAAPTHGKGSAAGAIHWDTSSGGSDTKMSN
jgi:hypothetical protein